MHRPFCPEVQLKSGKFNFRLKEYENKLTVIAEWYGKQYSHYQAEIMREAFDILSAEYYESNNQQDIGMQDLGNQFAMKQNLYDVVETLMKLMLSTFSYGPVSSLSTDCQEGQGWMDKGVKIRSFYLLAEYLNKELLQHEEGKDINISVFMEDREVRNNLTHRGDISICMSAIRCYNVLRKMLIFMDSEYEQKLNKFDFDFGNKLTFDCQDFIYRMNQFSNRENHLYFLVTGSMRDLPASDKRILANLPWDVVLDFDGSEKEGSLYYETDNTQHSIHRQMFSRSTVASLPLRSGWAEWLYMGDFLQPAVHKNRDLSSYFTIEEPYYDGKEQSEYIISFENDIEGLFKKLVEFDRPIDILIMYGDVDIGESIARVAYKYFRLNGFKITIAYYWPEEKINQVKRVFRKKSKKEVEKYFHCFPTMLPNFFDAMCNYWPQNGILTNSRTVGYRKVPSEDGLRQLPENLCLELEIDFEVLYEDVGQEENYEVNRILEFRQGGVADWSVFKDDADVMLLSRQEYDKFVNLLKTRLGYSVEAKNDKILFLCHLAGLGGSTLMRRIAWDMHFDYPVLIARDYRRGETIETIRNLYDCTHKGVLVMMDEDFSDVDKLQSDIGNLSRPVISLACRRMEPNGGDLPDSSLYKIQKLVKIKSQTEERLRSLAKQVSKLSLGEIQSKDRDYQNFIAQDDYMRCPFMINLYYLEQDFHGIDDYVRRTLTEYKMDKSLLSVVGFISLMDLYGCDGSSRLLLTEVVCNNYLDNKDDVSFIRKNSNLSNLLLPVKTSGRSTAYIQTKHPLLSEGILLFASENIYDTNNYKEVLDKWSICLIDMLMDAAEIQNEEIYEDNLKRLFIDRNFGNVQESFAKIIREIGTPEQRKTVLSYLAERAGKLADSLDYNSYQRVYMMAAHFYGHLGRYLRKETMEFDEALKAGTKAISFMEKVDHYDPNILHMHAENKYAILHSKWNELEEKNDKLSKNTFENLETSLDECITCYDRAACAGGEIYAYTSELKVYVDYLLFVYGRKEIKRGDDLRFLNERQRIYLSKIEELIYILDTMPMNKEANDFYNRYIKKYRTNIMLEDSGKTIEYFENLLNSNIQKHADSARISSIRRALINVRLWRYRKADRINYQDIDKEEKRKLRGLIRVALVDSYDTQSFLARRTVAHFCSLWIHLAKNTDASLEEAIKVAKKWYELDRFEQKNNPEPLYYLYVFYTISTLSGNSEHLKEANCYREKSMQVADELGRNDGRIKDVLLDGKGLEMLYPAREGRSLPDITNDKSLCLTVLRGKFNDLKHNNGFVTIQIPKEIQGEKAVFKINSQNTLGIHQTHHKVMFKAGFSYERIVAIDSTVKDVDTGEEL